MCRYHILDGTAPKRDDNKVVANKPRRCLNLYRYAPMIQAGVGAILPVGDQSIGQCFCAADGIESDDLLHERAEFGLDLGPRRKVGWLGNGDGAA